MRRAITALVALEPGLDEDAVRALLSETDGLEIAALTSGLDAAWKAMGERPTDVVLLACPADSELALGFLRESARAYPDRPVLVLSSGSPNGFVRHAFEAGADDLIVLPEEMPARPRSEERRVGKEC